MSGEFSIGRLALIAILGLLTINVALVNGETTEPPMTSDPAVRRAVDRGLQFLVNSQARSGKWEADAGGRFPVAMTSLAGMALLMDGNTTLQGRYSRNVQAAVSYLLSQSKKNGLIGSPANGGPTSDGQYMYGHGFSMLFLSQVVGEEEDADRRRQMIDVLTRAVDFCGDAQTVDGGWGYVSAAEGGGFDEGSVTITQMQGVRGCRNAGIAVPKTIIDKGVKYIERCTEEDGGVRYSLKTGGSGGRPPITAAAVACLFNAGEYKNPLALKLIGYADRTLGTSGRDQSYGHWHYAHYYYAQVVYRRGGKQWSNYRKMIMKRLIEESPQAADGSWSDGFMGAIYTTSLNLAILQFDNDYLPVYQR